MGGEKKTHLRLWVFLRILCCVLGITYVAAEQCDSLGPRACYEDLVEYETILFPLYGENEAKLDDTCGNMNMSFNCIRTYIEMCNENEECDENCTTLIKQSNSFLRITGLTKLYDNLCHKGSPLRQTYLENTQCLEKTADLYAECHNTSQTSQHYMHTTDGANTVEASCCYLSWYRDCFTNTTRKNCGENATIVVSIAAHYLIGDIADSLCSNKPVSCQSPPLPDDESITGNEIDTTDEDDKMKHKKDEMDNTSTDKSDTSVATTLYASMMITVPYVLAYFLI